MHYIIGLSQTLGYYISLLKVLIYLSPTKPALPPSHLFFLPGTVEYNKHSLHNFLSVTIYISKHIA